MKESVVGGVQTNHMLGFIVASRQFVERFGSEAIFRRSEAFRKLFRKRFDVQFLYNGFRKLLFDLLKLFGSSFGSKINLYEFPTRYYRRLVFEKYMLFMFTKLYARFSDLSQW